MSSASDSESGSQRSRLKTQDSRLNGILPIDKPQGWTSHDVVARVRRLAGQRQVGHAGTLDPLATGLLLLVLGSATRLSSYLMASTKAYCAEVVLGVATNTDDAEGEIVRQAPYGHVGREDAEAALSAFVGQIMQVPPAFAAVRKGGERLYALARKGIEVEVEARPVTVHALRLLRWDPPRVRLFVECGPGTYVRALARDLGEALGTCGYLHALRRGRSGGFRVEDAATLTQVEERGVEALLRRSDLAVPDLPAAVLEADDAQRVRHGGAVRVTAGKAGPTRLYDGAGRLLALAERQEEMAKPFLVFPADN